MIELAFVLFIIASTVLLGVWATNKSQSVSDFFVAGRSVNVFWNASAISGEYLSAASFMGVAGLIMKNGYDALWYPVGYAAGYLFLLLFIAGPLRRFGAYTIPDFAEGRFHSPAFRKIAVSFVLFIGFFYTMPQMKGAGTVMQGIMGWPYWLGIMIVGSVITFNVALGGMKGITIVQAMQYWVKVFAISVPCFVVMSFLGSYNETLGKALEVPKGVPIIPGSVISMKGKAGAPNNALALSTAGESLVKFESDAVLTSISVNPKPKKEDIFDASGAILAVGSSLEVSSKSKDLVVPKDTLVRVIPFEVTSAEGRKSKASLKLEFDQPSKIRVTAPRSQNDGDAFRGIPKTILGRRARCGPRDDRGRRHFDQSGTRQGFQGCHGRSGVKFCCSVA